MLYWEHFVEIIDQRIYESLCLSVQFSMEQLLEQRDYPIFSIDVSLQGSQVRFTEINYFKTYLFFFVSIVVNHSK